MLQDWTVIAGINGLDNVEILAEDRRFISATETNHISQLSTLSVML
jgi:hypothetical protein